MHVKRPDPGKSTHDLLLDRFHQRWPWPVRTGGADHESYQILGRVDRGMYPSNHADLGYLWFSFTQHAKRSAPRNLFQGLGCELERAKRILIPGQGINHQSDHVLPPDECNLHHTLTLGVGLLESGFDLVFGWMRHGHFPSYQFCYRRATFNKAPGRRKKPLR
jgi:hypothetical protein